MVAWQLIAVNARYGAVRLMKIGTANAGVPILGDMKRQIKIHMGVVDMLTEADGTARF